MVKVFLYSKEESDIPLIQTQIESNILLHESSTLETFSSFDPFINKIRLQVNPSIIIWRLEKEQEDAFKEVKEYLSVSQIYHLIILIIPSLEASLKGYEYNVYRCVPDQTLDLDLLPAIKAAMLSIAAKKRTILLTYQGGLARVEIDQLLYVIHQNRKNYIYKINDPTPLVRIGSLKDIFNELNDIRFCMIDKNCFINIKHVELVEKDYVKLVDSTVLTVSRRAKPFLKEMLLETQTSFAKESTRFPL